jgi:hypothetical protein
MDAGVQLARSQNVGTKVSAVLQKRVRTANKKFAERVSEAVNGDGEAAPPACARS